jgi:anti-anti-sigma regulatory factor
MEETTVKDAGIRAEETDSGRIVYVEGDLGLPRIAALREVLIESLRPGNSTVLDLTDVPSIELSGLQLVCSAHMAYHRRGAGFSVRGAGEGLRRIAARAGFGSRNPGRPCGNSGCIWGI